MNALHPTLRSVRAVDRLYTSHATPDPPPTTPPPARGTAKGTNVARKCARRLCLSTARKTHHAAPYRPANQCVATHLPAPSTPATPSTSSPSLPLAAQRSLELEINQLRRAVTHAFTSINVARRKWAAQSEGGKQALTACVNGLTQLAYAEGPHWGVLQDCTDMRSLVAVRALRTVCAKQAEVEAALDALAETLSGLTAASALLRERVEATRSDEARHAPLFGGCIETAQQFGVPLRPPSCKPRPHTPTTVACSARAVSHAEALVVSFEQELALRRTVAAELKHGAADEQKATLYLSAWVLQPYVDLDRLELLLTAVAAEGDPQNLVRSPRSR